jgi:hypothetical protein
MNGVKILSPERSAEIKAFNNTDFSDCPVMTGEELKRLRPRHPEYFKLVKNVFDLFDFAVKHSDRKEIADCTDKCGLYLA